MLLPRLTLREKFQFSRHDDDANVLRNSLLRLILGIIISRQTLLRKNTMSKRRLLLRRRKLNDVCSKMISTAGPLFKSPIFSITQIIMGVRNAQCGNFKNLLSQF